MQVHTRHPVTQGVGVHFNASGPPGGGFPIIQLDGTNIELYLLSVKDADDLIRAAAEAKSLLLAQAARAAEQARAAESEQDAAAMPAAVQRSVAEGEQALASGAPMVTLDSALAEADESFCGATSPTRYRHSKVGCTRPLGHDGDHEAGGAGSPPPTWPEGGEIDWDAYAAEHGGSAISR